MASDRMKRGGGYLPYFCIFIVRVDEKLIQLRFVAWIFTHIFNRNNYI